jgi:hypothetical protein
MGDAKPWPRPRRGPTGHGIVTSGPPGLTAPVLLWAIDRDAPSLQEAELRMVRSHRQDRTATGAVLGLAVVTQGFPVSDPAVACRARIARGRERAGDPGPEGAA